MAAGREKDWRKFLENMKEKRLAAGKEKKKVNKKARAAVPEYHLTVQRLNADVAGKLQKYSRIGAREFVPFDFDEYTIENIKSACMKHFGIPENGLLCCDVLAGEQGPSCLSVKQIPDFKVIHVRFIEKPYDEPEAKRTKSMADRSPVRDGQMRTKAAFVEETQPRSVQPTKIPCESRIPKSLSVVDMLRLGNHIKRTSTTIEIHTFDLKEMSWSGTPAKVDFNIEEKAFGTGGFREAFKASSKHKDYSYTPWVVKKYLPKSVEDMRSLSQSPEEHTKKAVQLHYLARNFAAQLWKDLDKEDNLLLFGETFSYNKVMFGYIRSTNECVTVEEFVEGIFDKYINNDGTVCGKDKTLTEKAECLSHYSY